jgi:RNA polymerase sigma-70 factor, ECF subfamily
MASKDAEEFDAFYAARAAPLVRLLYLRTGDLSRAQDCVQEAFARAWLRWGSLEAGPEPVGWVRTVAWNLAVSEWRSRRRERLRDDPQRWAGAAGESTPASPAAEVLAVRAELGKLPAGQQTAVVLHYFEDMSIHEIAVMTGQPAGTIKSNLHRARAALRTALSDDDSAQDRPHDPSPDPKGAAR